MLSANESYERSAQNIEVLTGIAVSHSTQQRLVHRHDFPEPVIAETVSEMSLDGGKVRLRTPLGEPCTWKDYKAIRLHDLIMMAYFRDNPGLIDWVNRQTLNTPFFALGDGHDGIWNVFAEIGPSEHRYEILDWFHLMENLHKVPGSLKRLQQVEDLLWKGNVNAAVESAIQQIGRRVKISGAQWDAKNVPQLLKHRCAYLNGYFSPTLHSLQ